MKPVLSTEKTENLRQRYDQWGQLLQNIDAVYRSSNDDKLIREGIRKQIYRDILEKSLEKAQRQHMTERNIQKIQDEKIKEHWRQEAEKRDRMQRQRKEKLKQANDFNKMQHMQLAGRHEEKPIEPAFNHQEQYEVEKQKNKNYQKLLQQYYQQQEHEKEVQKVRSKQLDLQQAYKKQQQSDEYEDRKNRYLQWLSEHHQQNMDVYNHIGQANQDRQRREQMLQRSIAVDGAIEIQKKLMDRYRSAAMADKQMRDKHVQHLQKQLEDDKYREAATVKLQKVFDKQIIDGTVNLYNAIQNRRIEEQKQENKRLALTLLQQQSQKRQREINQKNMDRKEARYHQSLIYPSANDMLGSPLHIGKMAYEDRLNQLGQIDRNLYQSLVMMRGGSRDRQNSSRQSNNPQPAQYKPSQVPIQYQALQRAHSQMSRSTERNGSRQEDMRLRENGSRILTGNMIT